MNNNNSVILIDYIKALEVSFRKQPLPRGDMPDTYANVGDFKAVWP